MQVEFMSPGENDCQRSDEDENEYTQTLWNKLRLASERIGEQTGSFGLLLVCSRMADCRRHIGSTKVDRSAPIEIRLESRNSLLGG